MNCKSCNGIMELNKEKSFYFCPYCNSTEIIPDDLTPDEIKDIVSEEVKKSGKKAKKDFEKDVTKIVKKTMAETETTKSSFKDILLAILLLVMAGFFLIMMLFGFSTEYKLFGFFSMLQFALAVTAFVMLLAKRNAMTRKIKLTIILLIVSCVFLMPVAVVCGMNADSNSSSSYRYTWMSIGMAEKVPEPEAKLTFFTTSNKNASFHFSDYKSGYAESYIALCKEKGFNIDIYVQDSNFIAYDENDNKLSIWEYNDSVSVTVEAPIDFSEFTWPNVGLAKLIPAPDSSKGSVQSISSSSFDYYVNDITEQKFIEYIESCKEAGFNINAYDRFNNNNGNYISYFSAKNADDAHLTLKLMRKDIMLIEIYQPNR